jgi:carbonic anhydrase
VATPAGPAVVEASARVQSGAVRQPGAELVRTAETAAPAGEVKPAFETQVEIPAKFLPGGKAAAEPDGARKSILPPLPRLGDQPAASAPVAPLKSPPAPSPVARAPEPAAAPTPSAAAVRSAARPPEPLRERPAAASAARRAAPPARQTASARAAAPASRPAAAASSSGESAPPAPQAPLSAAAVDALRAAGIRVTPLGAATPEWSYEGETGPQHWGRLRPEWRTCAEGVRQSPIDLRDGIVVDLAPVQFDYRRSGFRIRDTGNTLQVDVGEGMGITVRGVRYALERFTLHKPSQDRVGGMAHDMAMYLQHRSADGKQAIVSLLLAAGNAANPVLQTLWNNLPLDRGREFTPDAVLDLAALVPADPAHFLYTGSLPTPPCTEDVLWVVMKQPVPISDDQLAVFARLYPRNGRPIQPANGRLLLESRQDASHAR